MLLVSTLANPAPENAVLGTVRTRDGVLLRYARWPSDSNEVGTVCLLQGRAEFIEKYFETIRELRKRGFGVITFDWRGQGSSQRALPDTNKGHVEDFGQYELDFQTIMDKVVSSEYSRPIFALAHSMGAAILIRSARYGKLLFDRIVLASPMIGLPGFRSSAIARAAFHVMREGGFGTSYVPFGRSTPMDLRPFVGNRRTSDLQRYTRNAEILAINSDLGVGSPTVAWTDAALRVMREICVANYQKELLGRLLVVAPDQDDIVSTGASRSFAARQRIGSFVVVSGARHELLMEQNHFRQQFWAAFDAFTTTG